MADKQDKSEGRTVAQSRTTISRLMYPGQANLLGNVHGGEIMKMVDEVGGLTAARHCRRPVVTVAMDAMTFLEPVHVGDLMIQRAEVTFVGRTSMEIRVEVIAENPRTGEQVFTNWAYVVYVAVDDDGKPTPVPPLIAETDEERERMERASARQAYRIKLRKQESDSRISPPPK